MIENKMTAYVYGMRLRGFSPGAQPKDGFLWHKDSDNNRYYDYIAYNRRLTEKEIDTYSLDLVTEI